MKKYIYIKINKLKVLYVYTFKKYLNTWYFFNLFPQHKMNGKKQQTKP